VTLPALISESRGFRRVGCAALVSLFAAGCVQATPDLVLRTETAAPVDASLCARMADDFEMVLVEGTPLRGHLYRVSHADRAISARGVTWGFRLIDDDPAETCAATTKGMTCDISGPAEFRVQSIAGRATYMLLSGERARVASEGAIMTCRDRKSVV